MRRADRLFQVIQLLRARRTVTAAELSVELEVSERTVYRDVKELIGCGVPIEGEAGVGYVLDRAYDLPPLMFSGSELQALALGASMAAAFADEDLAKAARGALAKIEAALPPALRVHIEHAPHNAVRWEPIPGVEWLAWLRAAITDRQRATFGYTDAKGAPSERTVRPLGLYFWGATWTLTAWCELRDDFRHFRLDRIEDLTAHGPTFADEAGKTMADFIATVRCD